MLHQVAKGYMWLRLLRWLLIPDHWGWPGVITVALEERGETELERALVGLDLCNGLSGAWRNGFKSRHTDSKIRERATRKR